MVFLQLVVLHVLVLCLCSIVFVESASSALNSEQPTECPTSFNTSQCNNAYAICKNPATFNPYLGITLTIGTNLTAIKCDSVATGINNAAEQCAGDIYELYMRQAAAQGCCNDSLSACHTEDLTLSSFCFSSEAWAPTALLDTYGDCQVAVGFAADQLFASCASNTTTIFSAILATSGCCTDGRGRCWYNYSSICRSVSNYYPEDPLKTNPTMQWDWYLHEAFPKDAVDFHFPPRHCNHSIYSILESEGGCNWQPHVCNPCGDNPCDEGYKCVNGNAPSTYLCLDESSSTTNPEVSTTDSTTDSTSSACAKSPCLNSGDCQTQISEDEEVEVYCDCLAEYFGDFCETKIYHEYNSVFYVAYQTGGVDQDANCAQVLSDLPETLASYTATLGTVSSMFHVAEVDSTDTNCTVQVTVSSTLDAPSPTVVANLETRFNVLSDTVVVDQPAHLAVGVSTAIGSQLGAEGSTSVAVAANSGSTRDAADDALVISMFITLGVMLVVVVGAIGLFKMNAFGLRDLTHNKYTMPA